MASFSTSSINSLKKVSMMVSMGSEPSWNVVEHSGLFPFGFQFFTRLATVFAEEVADLFLFCLYSVLFEVVELVVSFTFRLK